MQYILCSVSIKDEICMIRSWLRFVLDYLGPNGFTQDIKTVTFRWDYRREERDFTSGKLFEAFERKGIEMVLVLQCSLLPPPPSPNVSTCRYINLTHFHFPVYHLIIMRHLFALFAYIFSFVLYFAHNLAVITHKWFVLQVVDCPEVRAFHSVPVQTLSLLLLE